MEFFFKVRKFYFLRLFFKFTVTFLMVVSSVLIRATSVETFDGGIDLHLTNIIVFYNIQVFCVNCTRLLFGNRLKESEHLYSQL
jgi:hypothetical protein